MADNRDAWKKTFTISHKSSGGTGCHVCRNAVSPTKPRKPFTCRMDLPMEPGCASFSDARKPSVATPSFLEML